MTWYAIQHKPTKTFFPVFKGGQRRGSTALILADFGRLPPRLFTNKTAAINCLRWWLKGVAVQTYTSSSDFFGSPDEEIGIKSEPQTGRHAEDMLVVEVGVHIYAPR